MELVPANCCSDWSQGLVRRCVPNFMDVHDKAAIEFVEKDILIPSFGACLEVKPLGKVLMLMLVCSILKISCQDS